MKNLNRLFIALVFLLATSAGNAQVKISQMPDYSGANLDSAKVPIVLGGVNYKTLGNQFILNRNTQKQAAAPWIDSIKTEYAARIGGSAYVTGDVYTNYHRALTNGNYIDMRRASGAYIGSYWGTGGSFQLYKDGNLTLQALGEGGYNWANVYLSSFNTGGQIAPIWISPQGNNIARFTPSRVAYSVPLQIGDTTLAGLGTNKLLVGGSATVTDTLTGNKGIYTADFVRVGNTGTGVTKPAKMVIDFGWSGSATFGQDTTYSELVFSPAWFSGTYKYAGAAIRAYFASSAAGIDSKNGLKFYTTGNDGYAGQHQVDREAMRLTPWGTLMVNSSGVTFDGSALQVKSIWSVNPIQTWYNAAGTLKANITDAGKLSVQALNVATPTTPSSSADAQGAVGDIARDDSYIYVKTSTGWKRAALTTF